jgi:hypothetical protein
MWFVMSLNTEIGIRTKYVNLAYNFLIKLSRNKIIYSGLESFNFY